MLLPRTIGAIQYVALRPISIDWHLILQNGIEPVVITQTSRPTTIVIEAHYKRGYKYIYSSCQCPYSECIYELLMSCFASPLSWRALPVKT